MKINGIENMTTDQLANEISQGGKFVMYEWCVSILIMTFKRGTDIYYIRPGESAVVKGLPWTFLSLLLGWWGIPWGFIYTPMALITNLGGGRDLTREVVAVLRAPAQAPVTIVPPGVGTTGTPLNPR